MHFVCITCVFFLVLQHPSLCCSCPRPQESTTISTTWETKRALVTFMTSRSLQPLHLCPLSLLPRPNPTLHSSSSCVSLFLYHFSSQSFTCYDYCPALNMHLLYCSFFFLCQSVLMLNQLSIFHCFFLQYIPQIPAIFH